MKNKKLIQFIFNSLTRNDTGELTLDISELSSFVKMNKNEIKSLEYFAGVEVFLENNNNYHCLKLRGEPQYCDSVGRGYYQDYESFAEKIEQKIFESGYNK